MGVNIDEILQSLEQEKTAEANFADNLNSNETPNDSETTEPSAPESVEITDDEMAKIAAECDAQGRIMARSFVSEINKIASDQYEEGAVEEGDAPEAPVSEAPVENTEETTEKVAEEYSPQERIIGTLYNNYFGGDENE